MINKIAIMRKIKGFTQVELAQKADISRPYLSQIEHDKVEPTIKIIFKIVRALECQVDDIFFEKNVSRKKQKGA